MEDLSISGVIRNAQSDMGGQHRAPGKGGCMSIFMLGLGFSMMWVSVVVLSAIFVYRVILPMTFMKPILDMITKG